MLILWLQIFLWIMKSFASDPRVSYLLLASMKLWQANFIAYKQSKMSGPSEFMISMRINEERVVWSRKTNNCKCPEVDDSLPQPDSPLRLALALDSCVNYSYLLNLLYLTLLGCHHFLHNICDCQYRKKGGSSPMPLSLLIPKRVIWNLDDLKFL